MTLWLGRDRHAPAFDDSFVLESLLTIVDTLFSKADNWLLSDDSRALMTGMYSRDTLMIQAESNVSDKSYRSFA
jgi:hypothetical protein